MLLLASASPARRRLLQQAAIPHRVQAEPISSREFCRLPSASEFCWGRMGVERVEAHFSWLIRLGVLRREVDGQGLTERVRLTPMGRELLSSIPGEIPSADPVRRLHHWLRRHRPRI